MSLNAGQHDIVREHLAEIIDFGDTGLSALAGIIASKLDETPQLAHDNRGRPVMRAVIDTVPYEFSRRHESIVVHSGDVRMNTGEISESSSLSDIAAVFTAWVRVAPD